jgi:DNA mismatch repair protein MutL
MVYAMVQRAVRAAVVATAEAPEIDRRAFSAGGESSAESRRETPIVGTEHEYRLDFRSVVPLEVPLRGADVLAQPEAVPPANALVGGRHLPVLRVLGQVFASYIIAEGPDGLYLIDQHAAHERILLERMIHSQRAQSTVSSQLLLQPLPLELSADELEAVLDHLTALQSIGFELEEFGEATVLLRALPGVLAEETRRQPLLDLLLQLVGADREAASHGETWEEHALANVACKAAIKAGQTLSLEEQRELIRQLEGAEARQSCCHGRPTMVHMSLPALERQFDRR